MYLDKNIIKYASLLDQGRICAFDGMEAMFFLELLKYLSDMV